jgi:hypothetical protein
MISLKIIDVKAFMNCLLIQNVFDNFLLSELELTTYNHFHISGSLNEAFYNSDEWEQLAGRKYSTWGEVKPIAFSLVKGSKLPLSIKIVFLLSSNNVEQVLKRAGQNMKPDDINGLFLNIKFEKGNVTLITGTSIKIFTLDKTLERMWDEDLQRFLKHYEIASEIC